jgi:hypothetical protein
MALGLVVCGTDSIPFEKWRVDLAFEGAWRAWQYRDRFPQVNTDISKGLDGVWAMTRATEGKQVWVLHWETDGGELNIYARHDNWDPDDEEDLAYALEMIDGDVPAEGWVSIAQDFLDRMNPSKPAG